MRRIIPLLAVLFMACAPAPQAQPTATPYPTYTPYPTLEPLATLTPYPTYTLYPTYTAIPSATATTTPAASATPSEPAVKMVDWNWDSAYGFATATGLIENVGKRPVKTVKICVALYDKDKKFMTVECNVIAGPVPPGAQSAWKVMVKDTGDFAQTAKIQELSWNYAD